MLILNFMFSYSKFRENDVVVYHLATILILEYVKSAFDRIALLSGQANALVCSQSELSNCTSGYTQPRAVFETNCVLFDACPPSLQDTVGSLPRLYYQTIVTLILATCEICGEMFYSIGLRF